MTFPPLLLMTYGQEKPDSGAFNEDSLDSAQVYWGIFIKIFLNMDEAILHFPDGSKNVKILLAYNVS